MTFQPGQRVDVAAFSTTVNGAHDNFQEDSTSRVWVDNPDAPGTNLIVPLSAVTLARPPLPTAQGSVIRVSNWHGPTGPEWTATLRPDGWSFAVDSLNTVYAPEDLELAGGSRFAWEPLYDAGAPDA